MKILFSVILISIAAYSYSQSYQSIFGDSTTSWNIAESFPDAIETRTYFHDGDTTLNNVNYQIVKRSWGDQGYLREDASTGKTWYQHEEDDFE